MKPLLPFALSILLIFLISCSREEEEEKLVTSFEGVVINSNTNEPLTDALIELMEIPWLHGSYDSREDYYTRVFQINADGAFNFSVTTSEAKKFIISIKLWDQRISSQCYDNNSESGYCHTVESGKEYKGLKIIGNPDHPIY